MSLKDWEVDFICLALGYLGIILILLEIILNKSRILFYLVNLVYSENLPLKEQIFMGVKYGLVIGISISIILFIIYFYHKRNI